MAIEPTSTLNIPENLSIAEVKKTVQITNNILNTWENVRAESRRQIDIMKRQIELLPMDLMVQEAIFQLAETKCKELNSTPGNEKH